MFLNFILLENIKLNIKEAKKINENLNFLNLFIYVQKNCLVGKSFFEVKCKFMAMK